MLTNISGSFFPHFNRYDLNLNETYGQNR